MSEARVPIAEQLDRYSDEMPDEPSDIIDISAINFGSNDSWLQSVTRNPAEYNVHDLRAWMRADVEQDCGGSHDNRRSIDTRTFTRPKKRSGRLNFESIVEVTTPTSPNVWKPQCSLSLQTNEEDAEPLDVRRDSTPAMLRPSNPGVSGLCSADAALTSGPASLEAFLNMSQSNGIDSFINLGEPEFNDTLMNTSQPSILYSSIMSTTLRDDLSQTLTHQPAAATATTTTTNNQSQLMSASSIEDSQILTESMMQTSMFGDVTDVNFNDTFAKTIVDAASPETSSFCTEDDRTFVASPAVSPLESSFVVPKNIASDASFVVRKNIASDASFVIPKNIASDASFVVQKNIASDASFVVRKNIASDASFIVQKNIASDASFIVQKNIASDASFVVQKNTASDASFVVRKNIASDASFVVRKDVASDASYVVPKDDDIAEEATYRINVRQPVRKDIASDASFVVRKDVASDASFVVRKDVANDASFIVRKDVANDASYVVPKDDDIPEYATYGLNVPEPDDVNDTFRVPKFDATFERTLSPSPRESSQDIRVSCETKPNVPRNAIQAALIETLDATYERRSPASSPRNSSTNATFRAPTINPDNDRTARHTLKSPAAARMDTTYDNVDNNSDRVPITNRYNTYRKGSMAQERARNENCATNNFTSRPQDSARIVSSLDNLDANNDKRPATKLARKLNAPRALSRLPQTLQKSNPNLISNSLKSVNACGARTAIPSFGYRKSVAPGATRTVGATITGKLYGLGKISSGSEQRLEATRNPGEFSITGTGGSTESIDSTQSAHSAPDFDDRLSVCSDSSHTSYSGRTINIEDLQKTAHMRDDYLKKGSTPKPRRGVLENNWIEAAKDLPSPILKSEAQTYGSRGSSPRSTDSTVKTSSPLLSPAGSLQNLTINVTHSVNNADKTKLLSPRNEHIAAKGITEATVKPARSAGEHRTGLRPPASWSSANQRPASGIPRPASRIPAPRFARPPTKISQGGIKKGFL